MMELDNSNTILIGDEKKWVKKTYTTKTIDWI
jgi:hypothetical protein